MQVDGDKSLVVTAGKGLKPEKWMKMFLVLRTLAMLPWLSTLSDANDGGNSPESDRSQRLMSVPKCL